MHAAPNARRWIIRTIIHRGRLAPCATGRTGQLGQPSLSLPLLSPLGAEVIADAENRDEPHEEPSEADGLSCALTFEKRVARTLDV